MNLMNSIRINFGLKWPGKYIPLSFYLKVLKYLSVIVIIVGSHWFMAISKVQYGTQVDNIDNRVKSLAVQLHNAQVANKELFQCINSHTTVMIDDIAVNCQK